MNAISANTIKTLGLPTAPHPNPYKVSWIDSTSILIKSRCLVQLQLQSYQEKVRCDILPMEESSIILGRPWLFDHDATLYGCTNSCSFMHLGKRFVIHPTPPKDAVKRGSSHLKEIEPRVNLITTKEIEKELTGGTPIWILATKDIQEPPQNEYPQEVIQVREEFWDVFPDDLPNHLPSLQDI